MKEEGNDGGKLDALAVHIVKVPSVPLHSPPTLPPSHPLLSHTSPLPHLTHAHLQYISTAGTKEHLSAPDSPHRPHDSH